MSQIPYRGSWSMIRLSRFCLGNWQAISLRKRSNVQRENILALQPAEKASTLYWQRAISKQRKLERMWDETAQHYEVDVLCGYFREDSISTLEPVCAEHTATHGRFY